jgi:hypothetical protein
VLAAGGWLVFDSLRAREAAVQLGKAECRQHGLQFLDDTVRCTRTRPARDDQGHFVLERTYAFEFSDDRMTRRAGAVVTLGATAHSVELEPYRAPDAPVA